VWAGARGGEAVVKTAPRSGFETAIQVPRGQNRFFVQALDRAGHPIGRSEPFSLEPTQG
jgi:hypothetical protein